MRKQQHGQPGPESQGASPLFDPLIPLTRPNLSVGSNTDREQQDTAGCSRVPQEDLLLGQQTGCTTGTVQAAAGSSLAAGAVQGMG